MGIDKSWWLLGASLAGCAGGMTPKQQNDFDDLRHASSWVHVVQVEGCATLTKYETIVLYENCDVARLARADDALDVSNLNNDGPGVVEGNFTCMRISGEFRKFGRFITVGYFFGTIGHVT